MKTHCGNYIEQQFGATHTCKEGDWQCNSCQVDDLEKENAELKAELAEADAEIDRLAFYSESMHKQIAALKAELKTVQHQLLDGIEIQTQLNEVRGELTALKAQEPVAYQGGDGALYHYGFIGAIPLFTTPQPAAVPAGWKLVPVEPTKEMRKAGSVENDSTDFATLNAVRSYKAMLAAAPEAPQAQDKSKCKDHPDAPHGFDRTASHNADRYVCTCESWQPQDKESWEDGLCPYCYQTLKESK